MMKRIGMLAVGAVCMSPAWAFAAELDHKVVAVNDTLGPVAGKVKIVDRESGKVLLEKSYSVPVNAAAEIGVVAWSGQGILDIAYEQGGEEHVNWFLFGEPPFDFKKVMRWMK